MTAPSAPIRQGDVRCQLDVAALLESKGGDDPVVSVRVQHEAASPHTSHPHPRTPVAAFRSERIRRHTTGTHWPVVARRGGPAGGCRARVCVCAPLAAAVHALRASAARQQQCEREPATRGQTSGAPCAASTRRPHRPQERWTEQRVDATAPAADYGARRLGGGDAADSAARAETQLTQSEGAVDARAR